MIQWLIGLLFSEVLGGGFTIALFGAATLFVSTLFALQGLRLPAYIVFIVGFGLTSGAGGIFLAKGACDARIAAYVEQLRQAEDAERERQAQNREIIRKLNLANASLTAAAGVEREKVIVNERRILIKNPDCARWSAGEFERLHRIRQTRRRRRGN